MIIPNSAIRFILFQRTPYLISHKSPLLNRFVFRIPSRMYNVSVAIEALCTKARVRRLFTEDMNREYQIMKEYLPARARAILDIGCGVAGIDVLLYQHYVKKGTRPFLSLLDKTEMPKKVYYGLEQNGCYYNSLACARDLLTQNNVPPNRIGLEEADAAHRISFTGPFDLVVSLISWGFHYPVSVYLDQVYALMSPGGILILDVRNDSDGMEQIRRKFGNAKIISSAQKYHRVVAKK